MHLQRQKGTDWVTVAACWKLGLVEKPWYSLLMLLHKVSFFSERPWISCHRSNQSISHREQCHWQLESIFKPASTSDQGRDMYLGLEWTVSEVSLGLWTEGRTYGVLDLASLVTDGVLCSRSTGAHISIRVLCNLCCPMSAGMQEMMDPEMTYACFPPCLPGLPCPSGNRWPNCRCLWQSPRQSWPNS